MKATAMSPKRIFGGILAIVVLVISLTLPDIGGLSAIGVHTLGFLIAYLICLVLEVIPIITLTLLAVGLMPLLGIVANLNTALSGFGNQVIWFCMASFGISKALTSTPVTNRILKLLLKLFGKSAESVLFALMASCALISSIISNVPCCAIFMVIALQFMELYKDPTVKRRAGKMFMIAIPIASMLGGMMTPAGSSLNVLAISQLENLTGDTIPFVNWMLLGIPLCVVMLPIAWFLMCKIFKPDKLTAEEISAFIAGIEVPEKMDARETKVVVITIVMFVLWVASSWVSFLNTFIVAILGCVILFLPGFNILEPRQFTREYSWDAFFLIGGVLSLGSALVANGVSTYIAGIIPALDLPLPLFIAFAGLIVFVALIFVPTAPSLIPVLAIPMVTLAANTGLAPAILIACLGLCANNCYLLPLDAVCIITYSQGYYKMTDNLKVSIPLQICMVILCAAWLPIAFKILGLV